MTWTTRLAAQPAPAPEYLYLWTASADSTQPDFLAVLDVTEDSARYGRLVTTLPVPGRGNTPHHTEHEMPADRQLFANGFDSGETFVFDLTDPARPRIAAQFGEVEGYSHPHSYFRLPGGHVLATFQMRHGAAGMAPGGLVELTPPEAAGPLPLGRCPGPRSGDPGLQCRDRARARPHRDDHDGHGRRALPRPASSRSGGCPTSRLLHTITLPDGPAGDESMLTAEPRLLDDGRTVLVSTFSCGLYLMEGLEGETPARGWWRPSRGSRRRTAPSRSSRDDYYLVTVPAWSAVVSLDISDPAAPREVSRVTLGPDDVPHWISMSPDRRRVVVTGYGAMKHRVVIARFDSTTGRLSLDERFREEGASEPGFRMDDKTWPHGGRPRASRTGRCSAGPDRRNGDSTSRTTTGSPLAPERGGRCMAYEILRRAVRRSWATRATWIVSAAAGCSTSSRWRSCGTASPTSIWVIGSIDDWRMARVLAVDGVVHPLKNRRVHRRRLRRQKMGKPVPATTSPGGRSPWLPRLLGSPHQSQEAEWPGPRS